MFSFKLRHLCLSGGKQSIDEGFKIAHACVVIYENDSCFCLHLRGTLMCTSISQIFAT